MELAPDDPRLLPIHLRRELIAEGYTDRALSRALRRGELARPRRGAYVDGGVWPSLTPEEQYAVRVRAAHRQARADVVLSHTSSLPFLDAPLWGFDLRDCHLTRTDQRSGRREGGIRQHVGTLLAGDVTTTHGVPHTSAVRAGLEATTVASAEAALMVVCHLLHTGQCTEGELRERYGNHMETWPASLRTDLVLRLADGRIETPGEARTFYLCWRARLPKLEPQFEVYDGADLVARLDFALPEHGIWLEFDGRIKYGKLLKAGESASDVVVREKRREERVTELTGWRCLRITWADLENPERLVARIRALIELVARQRGPRR